MDDSPAWGGGEMRASHIDFSKTGTKEPLIGWALLFLGMATFTACAIHYTRSQAKRDADQVRTELIQQGEVDTAASTAHRVQEIDQSSISNERRWHKAIRELQSPWVETLADIEKATRAPVLLTSIKPEPSAGVLTLEAEAPSFNDMLKYVSRLQKSNTLPHAQLQSHQEASGQQGTSVIHFVVQARWGEKL